MTKLISRIGVVNQAFETFVLKSVLTKNDAGDWGDEPQANAIGIIRSTNFRNTGKLDLSNVAYRSLKPHKQIEKKIFEGDILIERSGGSDVQPVGRVGFIDSDIASVNFAFANFIQRISVDESVVPKFLHFCLQQMYEMGITETMQNQTTGIRNLDWKQYIKSEFPKPPKPEQTAIATLLSKVDEAIAATQASIKTAEKLKKALMQNLLTGKLKPDGTWRSEDEFYEDEKFGKVPKGWEVKSIDELVNRKTDTIDPLKSKDIFDYVGLEHIAQGEFVRIGKGKSDETLALKVIFDKGDLLYGKLRPYLNKVWLADLSGVGSTEFLVFEKNEFIEWVYLNLQTKRFLDFTLSMTAGTQHPRASWRDVKRFLIIKPSDYSELQLISNKILSTEKDKLDKQTKIQTLQHLKKSLMQNLLTGKVRLPQEFIAQFEEAVEEVIKQ
jgi:type I restriction enzyme, S subunit